MILLETANSLEHEALILRVSRSKNGVRLPGLVGTYSRTDKKQALLTANALSLYLLSATCSERAVRSPRGFAPTPN